MNTITQLSSNYLNYSLRKINGMRSLKYKKMTSQIIANITQESDKDIFQITKNVTLKKVRFFKAIAEKYNKMYFNQKLSEQEKPDIVKSIFEIVKWPQKIHFELLTSFNGSLNTLKRIFIDSQGQRSKIKFANRINKEIFNEHHHVNFQIIPELLESKNYPEYHKNLNKYKSYLKLNRNNENAIKELDQMVSSKTYNQSKYDKIYTDKIRARKFCLIETPDFTKEDFLKDYNKHSTNLLNSIVTYYNVSLNALESGEAKEIAEIYKSTTKANFKLRNEFIKKFPRHNYKNKEGTISHDLAEYNKLFKLIESNKDAKQFIQSILGHHIYFQNIKELNNILETISPKKLNIFQKNARRIMHQTYGEERLTALQENLENPLFETEISKTRRLNYERHSYHKLKSRIHRIYLSLINRTRMIQYHLTMKDNNTKFTENIQPEITKPELKMENITKQEEKNIIEKVQITPKEKEVTAKKNTKITDKKNELINKISELISKKLGSKTLKEQQRDYGIKAAQMRLDLLPEIFASIKDTRKADRLAGKKRIKSSNKDALELYELIKGRNKKYINYLLKKRKDDNTRLFEIKDIINIIKQAEAKILKDKNANPNYKANDARKYYNYLYEAKIQEYGKLKRTHKLNTKA